MVLDTHARIDSLTQKHVSHVSQVSIARCYIRQSQGQVGQMGHIKSKYD